MESFLTRQPTLIGDHLTLVSDLVSKLKVDGSKRMTAKAVPSQVSGREIHPH